jgi:hypothetical protein
MMDELLLLRTDPLSFDGGFIFSRTLSFNLRRDYTMWSLAITFMVSREAVIS